MAGTQDITTTASKKTVANTFHHFVKLPAELRIKVWKDFLGEYEADYEPIIWQIEWQLSWDFNSRGVKIPVLAPCVSSLSKALPVCPLLYVSSETRAEALKVYTILPVFRTKAKAVVSPALDVFVLKKSTSSCDVRVKKYIADQLGLRIMNITPPIQKVLMDLNNIEFAAEAGLFYSHPELNRLRPSEAVTQATKLITSGKVPFDPFVLARWHIQTLYLDCGYSFRLGPGKPFWEVYSTEGGDVEWVKKYVIPGRQVQSKFRAIWWYINGETDISPVMVQEADLDSNTDAEYEDDSNDVGPI